MSTKKFIIVSNRLPISVSKENGKLTFNLSVGGVATAMSSVGSDQEKIWIGWPGIGADELTAADKRSITQELRKHNCFPVYLTTVQVQNFYAGYSNATLWPLFHYFPHYMEHNNDYWLSYKKTNALFRDAVLKFASADSTIWVHDYHLMLLPELLRAKLPQNAIGFFLHTPFPSFEIFRLLPNGKEILKGLLGADLIGFHTYDYTRHFLSSVTRILGYENTLGTIARGNRLVRADSFPIGIDYQKFYTGTKEQGVQTEVRALRAHFNDQKIILSFDRVDYSKGILKRLDAFEIFLEHNPRYHKKVAMIMIAAPSRSDVPAYQELLESIERQVSHINGKYAAIDWAPINYQYKTISFDQIVALYDLADVALVTPLRDGMNLIAKEYVASKPGRKGVLILSEMAGAASELPEATLVNPNHTEEVTNAIFEALNMPVAEQKRRMRAMQSRLSKYTAQRWADDFLNQLEIFKKQQAERTKGKLTAAGKEQILKSYKSAHKRLFLLDYDGTLANFVSSPSAAKARPSKQLLAILKKLSDKPQNKVYIISGRPKQVLEQWFKGVKISLAAEHGSWIKEADNWKRRGKHNTRWKDSLVPILQSYEERTPGAVVEYKDNAVVWHYRNVAHELAFVRNTELRHELRQVLNGTDIGLYDGNKIIEVKPLDVHKGTVAGQFAANNDYSFILAAGDDYTDEDMFEALPKGAFTLKVGLGDTGARMRLTSVEETVKLLSEIAIS